MEDGAGPPSDGQQAIVQQCLAMKEQYKRARDKLLVELSAQSEELERLQADGHVLTTSVKVRARLSLFEHSHSSYCVV